MNVEIISPDECFSCKTPIDTLIQAYGGFLIIPVLTIVKNVVMPVYGVVLCGCPHCGAVMLNKNAQDNQKAKMQEIEKQNLIARPSTNLILPVKH